MLRAVDADDAYANLVLPGLLRRAALEARDAALATELAYGALRGQGLYDPVLAHAAGRDLAAIDPPVLDALRLGAHQLLATRIPPHAAVSQTVALVRAEIGSGPAGFVNAVLRRVAERSREQWLDDLTTGDLDGDLALRHSHPAWVVRALRDALVRRGRPAAELEDLLAADNAAPRVTLAARPGLVTVAELLATATDATAGPWSPHAVTLAAGAPAAVPAVARGHARVQDAGSQLVAAALAAAPLTGPDTRWLDLCAGPGGKTALLSGLAADRGAAVVAVESAPHRAELVRRAVTPDIGNPVEVRIGDGREVGHAEPGGYDRILVDVPCTGLGALRRRPEARWRRRPADLAALGPLQRDLLRSALAAARPGAVVAYATCSPHLAETTLVVDDVLRTVAADRIDARPVLTMIAGKELPSLGDGPDVQLWPHLHGTDAMYLSLLRRR